jgi:MYXO-CTERM domain-containing protein
MRLSLIELAGCMIAGSAFLSAAPLTVASYDMLNGEAHHYNYMDKSYNGSGTPTLALSPLSNGTGLLTDGSTGATDWGANLGNGPAYEWVGWALNSQNNNPVDTNDTFATITFKLTSPADVNTVSLFINNFNPGVIGGVSLFGTATISFSNDDVNFVNSITYTPTAAEHADTTARYINISTNQVTPFQYVQVHLTHDPTLSNSWVFLSEVTFDGTTAGTATPEPASGLLAVLGLCGLVWHSRRRKA